MKRRSFLAALLAAPVAGHALAKGLPVMTPQPATAPETITVHSVGIDQIIANAASNTKIFKGDYGGQTRHLVWSGKNAKGEYVCVEGDVSPSLACQRYNDLCRDPYSMRDTFAALRVTTYRR